MAAFIRSKRVTDPLDEQARARLVGPALSYSSSGSEHSADDDDSPCLSELVHGFLEQDDSESAIYDSDADRFDSVSDSMEDADGVLRSALVNNRDGFRNLILSHVLKAMERFWSLRDQISVFRRKVMVFLRDLGYNAAICKTKWDSSGGLTAGTYEFIDVVQSTSSGNRYIVDLDFASQFEVARPTTQYLKLFQSMPKVFCGRNEDLKRIIKVMSDAAKRSLKSRDLSLPPWRKNRYMQNKWLGPYRRSSNQVSLTPVIPSVNGVQCRLVGFDDAVSGRLFVRTR
ncbi:uncharacterized protein [Euphorbia lathyris]|uniref:uncharacterized protein n=1 Tax=Euphorbia lathyris TaxID=212925 RepID=UPI00331431B9